MVATMRITLDRVIVAERQPPKGIVKTSSQASRGKASAGFTVEERAAMRERVREVRAEGGGRRAEGGARRGRGRHSRRERRACDDR